MASGDGNAKTRTSAGNRPSGNKLAGGCKEIADDALRRPRSPTHPGAPASAARQMRVAYGMDTTGTAPMDQDPDYRHTINLRPSWRTRALNALLRLTARRRVTRETDVAALRRDYEEIDARYIQLAPDVLRTPVDCGGVPAEWIALPESRDERVILYLHGGSFAFRFPNAHAALVSRLCRRLGARALIPDYRLAPEHPFPAAPDDCHRTYQALMAQGVRPRNIVIAGDSAGGNLALVTIHRARFAGEPLPSCAVLLSPALDCTLTSPSMADYDGLDPVLHLRTLLVLRRCYVQSPHQYIDPEVSPLFADFRGFPPLFLQAGSSEMLRDEAVRAADRAHAAGVDVELEIWPEVPHAFQIAQFLPEASLAIEHIAHFVQMRTGWGDVDAGQHGGRSSGQ
ncbi:MAG TPA: alpha/beta hydrolase [Candidatus Accumulibacter sp.]|nr:alpha/beta hydrolase [Accumulibacter sp.]